jgi:hypothetical protein
MKKSCNENLLNVTYACYLMALKFEEIYPPSIHEWLPSAMHKKVYKWESEIVYEIKFQFLNESARSYLDYYGDKYKLTKD